MSLALLDELVPGDERTEKWGGHDVNIAACEIR